VNIEKIMKILARAKIEIIHYSLFIIHHSSFIK